MFQYTIPNPSLIWKPLDRITTHQGDISVDCRISNFPSHPWCALRAKQGALASDGSTEWITEEQNTVQPTEKRESSKKKNFLH